jgi:SanA protein
MEAAAQLYHHGKVKYLLLSGDNRTEFYNEPVTMKKALLKLGVPDSAMTLDYAGFRTLDSIVRANKVFGLSQVTIVSQSFHTPRALFIADHSDLRAIAYAAQPVQSSSSAYIDLRERLARFLAVVDLFVLNKQPRFLGDPIPIPQAQSDSLSS